MTTEEVIRIYRILQEEGLYDAFMEFLEKVKQEKLKNQNK